MPSIRAAVDFAVRQRNAIERAQREYPDLCDEGSPLRRAVSAAYERAVTDLDERIEDPEFPYVLTKEMADRFGIEPAKPETLEW